MTMDLLRLKDFAERSGYAAMTLYKMREKGQIVFTKNENNKTCIDASYLTKLNRTRETQMETNGEEWLSVVDFQRATGLSHSSVNLGIKNKVYKAKKVPSANGAAYKWMIHSSQVEIGKARVGTKRGPNLPQKKRPELDLAAEDLAAYEMDDCPLDGLDTFVADRGKVPFKNMCVAVKMAMDRKPWETIEYATGMKRPHLLKFIAELKEARATDPKKYPTVMAYLNADRPFNPMNKNMVGKD